MKCSCRRDHARRLEAGEETHRRAPPRWRWAAALKPGRSSARCRCCATSTPLVRGRCPRVLHRAVQRKRRLSMASTYAEIAGGRGSVSSFRGKGTIPFSFATRVRARQGALTLARDLARRMAEALTLVKLPASVGCRRQTPLACSARPRQRRSVVTAFNNTGDPAPARAAALRRWRAGRIAAIGQPSNHHHFPSATTCWAASSRS